AGRAGDGDRPLPPPDRRGTAGDLRPRLLRPPPGMPGRPLPGPRAGARRRGLLRLRLPVPPPLPLPPLPPPPPPPPPPPLRHPRRVYSLARRGARFPPPRARGAARPAARRSGLAALPPRPRPPRMGDRPGLRRPRGRGAAAARARGAPSPGPGALRRGPPPAG